MTVLSLHYSSKTPLAGAFGAVQQIVSTWRQRARDRRELARLDGRSIHDLGLSPGDVQFEVNKPFWRS